MRTNIIKALKTNYIPERLTQIDKDFLSFEEDLIALEDLNKVQLAIDAKLHFDLNPYNSIILYLTGLTDQFNYSKARADTIGGSPPDIDIDFEALGRDRAIGWVINEWGRTHVANIMAHGTFKPKSLTRRFFKITEGDPEIMREILRAIPKPKAGKEANLERILRESPWLAKESKYTEWLEFVTNLEGMTANFRIHAAGIVISDHEIPETIPCWKNSKSEFITQYDMHEVEELGSIKFDFLVINNLDILKKCTTLINERHGINYDIYNIKDKNKKAYDLITSGLLTGVFQMETSGGIKDLARDIQPNCLDETSDILALYRPGPMNAGLLDEYIKNKKNGYPPENMPMQIREILKGTYWTLVYQEQVMALCQFAGFDLRESDDVRRAMGKKKIEVLLAYRNQFTKGLEDAGLTHEYASNLWQQLAGKDKDPDDNGFAAYCFNKSHSIAYSRITYLCAYFKANYPIEFFTALMSVRSKVMQPKLWQQKAPEFVNEAKKMNVHISAPYIQTSELGFTIQDNKIYFGLNAIKQVGITACKSIIAARKQGKFKDIWDFLSKVDKRKVTIRTFEALVMSGAFDKMGYMREELLDNSKNIYTYYSDNIDYTERIINQKVRAEENIKKNKQIETIAADVKLAKSLVKKFKKDKIPCPQHIINKATRELRLRQMRKEIKNSGLNAEEILSYEDLEEYNESILLRKKPELKQKEKPVKPILTRSKQIKINVQQLMDQADYIGCYLEKHPAPVLYPDTTRICNANENEYLGMAGQITLYKQITTRSGKQMAFLEMGDGTGIAELVIFPRQWAILNRYNNLPEIGDIVLIECEVETMTDTSVKVIVKNLKKYKPVK